MLLLNGKEVSEALYEKLIDIKKKKNIYPSKLIIITVGNDEASKVYVRNKLKACEKVGIVGEHVIVDERTNQHDFEEILLKLIEDNFYSIESPYFGGGIILQLPVPNQMFESVFNETIPSSMDLDGFGDKNKLLMYSKGKEPFHYPATPKGIMTLLEHYKINVEGKHVVIIGRSEIVGKPLATMMLDKDATVTICHSKTQNLEKITKQADILVVAIGKPKFINSSHISEGVTIIDVGINRTEEGLCGDVDFEDCKDKCYAITPVPGGVGPMTVYSLMENIINIANI